MVDLPEAVSMFIGDFDSGDYPELVLEDPQEQT
jgi:hypothetical protein